MLGLLQCIKKWSYAVKVQLNNWCGVNNQMSTGECTAGAGWVKLFRSNRVANCTDLDQMSWQCRRPAQVLLFLSHTQNKKWHSERNMAGELHIAFIRRVRMNMNAFLLRAHCVTKVCVYSSVYLSHTFAQRQLLVTWSQQPPFFCHAHALQYEQFCRLVQECFPLNTDWPSLKY